MEDLYNFISKADILSQITINGTQEQIHSIHIATVPEGMTALQVSSFFKDGLGAFSIISLQAL